MQNVLELKHREHFVENYLNPALNDGYIEMTFPESPFHPNQKYRLTKKGWELRKVVQDQNTLKP